MEQAIKSAPSNFVKNGRSYYLLIPSELLNDSSFPFKPLFVFLEKNQIGKLEISIFSDRLEVKEAPQSQS